MSKEAVEEKILGASIIGEAGAGGALDPHFVPWNPAFIRKLLIGLVRKKIVLFAIYPEIGKEDLLQVAEKAMSDAWPKWNYTRMALSTYLYKCGANAIISVWREAEKNHRSEQGKHRVSDADEFFEGAAAADKASLEGLAAVLSKVSFDPKESVRDWLKRLYDAAAKHTDPAWKRDCTFAQAAAITCLMKRMKVGFRGVRYLLEQQDDYREALRLGKHIPATTTLFRFSRDFMLVGGTRPTP